MLVLNSNLHAFRNFKNKLDDTTLEWHAFVLEDGIKECEFYVKVKVFTFLLDFKSMKANKLYKRLEQGDGMTLYSLEYPSVSYPLQLKDYYSHSVQLCKRVSGNYVFPNFAGAVGCSIDPSVHGPRFHASLNYVHGDHEQTLRIIVDIQQRQQE